MVGVYDPNYKSGIARNWLLHNGPSVFPKPQYSDLSVIEYLWGNLKMRMAQRYPQSLQELKKVYSKTGKKPTQNILKSYTKHSTPPSIRHYPLQNSLLLC